MPVIGEEVVPIPFVLRRGVVVGVGDVLVYPASVPEASCFVPTIDFLFLLQS